MSEVSKFDLSRIKISNAGGKVKVNEIVLPKTDIPTSVKGDAIDTENSNSADTVKTDEVVDKKNKITDTVKNNEMTDKKTKTADTVKTDEVVDKKINTADTVKATEIDTEKTSVSRKQKNLAEAAKDIQALLAPLQTTYPTNSDYEKQVFVNKFREEIRRNSHVQEVLVAGEIELIKIICQPLGIPIEMGKKWLETAKRNQ